MNAETRLPSEQRINPEDARRAQRIRQAIDAMRWHIELGWDLEYGGIVLARDGDQRSGAPLRA